MSNFYNFGECIINKDNISFIAKPVQESESDDICKWVIKIHLIKKTTPNIICLRYKTLQEAEEGFKEIKAKI